MSMPPLAVSCGDPSGIGPEIAAKAWAALKGTLPFAWIGDPSHLPQGTPVAEVQAVEDALGVGHRRCPFCRWTFPPPPSPAPRPPRTPAR